MLFVHISCATRGRVKRTKTNQARAAILSVTCSSYLALAIQKKVKLATQLRVQNTSTNVTNRVVLSLVNAAKKRR